MAVLHVVLMCHDRIGTPIRCQNLRAALSLSQASIYDQQMSSNKTLNTYSNIEKDRAEIMLTASIWYRLKLLEAQRLAHNDTSTLRVIVGKGSHSTGGEAILQRSVQNHLLGHHYKFEQRGGMLTVHPKRRWSLQSRNFKPWPLFWTINLIFPDWDQCHPSLLTKFCDLGRSYDRNTDLCYWHECSCII